MAVNGRSSEVDPGATTSSSANERLTLKWAVPVNDVELIDGAAGGTLARVLAYGGSGTISSSSGSGSTNKRSSLTRTVTPNHLGLSSLTLSSDKEKEQSSSGQEENLAQDRHDLMHDFDVVSRISGLIGSLKGEYEVIIGIIEIVLLWSIA